MKKRIIGVDDDKKPDVWLIADPDDNSQSWIYDAWSNETSHYRIQALGVRDLTGLLYEPPKGTDYAAIIARAEVATQREAFR